MNKTKFIKIIGKIITILSIVFIIQLVLSFDVNFKFLLNPVIIITIVLLSLLLSSSVVLNSIAWKKLIEMLTSSKPNVCEVVHIYIKANIGKYLPGNVMHYAFRNIIGIKYNINQLDMLYSTVFEVILKIISAFLLVVIFVFDDLLFVIRALDDRIYLNISTLLILVVMLVLSIAILLFYISKKKFKRKININNLFFAFIIYSVIFFLNVFIFIIVAKIVVNSEILNEKLMYISGIYIIAWLLGYLTPGSPGGIGVREAVMILMLKDIFSVNSIVIISTIIRLITMLSDLFAYAANAFWERRMRKEDETNNSNTMLQ